MTPTASPPPVSAYIPCFNNAATLAVAIEGLKQQSVPVDDLFVVDDGSTDGSREIAQAAGVRVVEMKTNAGRGAVRARAMEEARHDLVACCDATNRMRGDFLAHAVPWFSDPAIAALHGLLIDPNVRGVVSRWRARHLFRQEETFAVKHHNTLNTWGAVVRKSAALQVGNYDARLRHSEDNDLGARLAAAGYDILFDPATVVEAQTQNTLLQAMERYARWNHGDGAKLWENFCEAQVVALKILAPRDVLKRDFPGLVLTCLMPYFQFFSSYRLRRAEGK